MRKDNNWFTLSEILISISILSIVIFWILKMINENKKLITNNNNVSNMYNILLNTKECINYFWYSSFINNSATWYSINFWNNNSCETGAIDEKIINLNWKDYNTNLYIKKELEQIKFEIEINWNWIWKIKDTYIIKK